MTAEQIDTQIYNTAKKSGFSDALSRLIVAQARHETGNYSSNVFRACNNLFGYKFVNGKWQAASCVNAPEGGKYARYNSVSDSVNELIDWLRRREREGRIDTSAITNSAEYATALKKSNYYTDSVRNYQKGLDLALNKIKIVAGTGLGLVLLAAGIYFYTRSKKRLK